MRRLAGALRQHAQSLRRSTDIDVELTISVTSAPPLNVAQLNRIVQEALSNVGRHPATRAEIGLSSVKTWSS